MNVMEMNLPRVGKHADPAPIHVSELRSRILMGDVLTIVDVREEPQYAAGHLRGALHAPDSDPSGLVTKLQGLPEAVLVCDDGKVSMMVGRTLGFCGFRGLLFLEGGLKAWAATGGVLMETTPSGAERPIAAYREGAAGKFLTPILEAISMRTVFLGLASSVAVVAGAMFFLTR